jgi:PadR family transcriptional regulator PadR
VDAEQGGDLDAAQLLRGVLDLAVLAVLERADGYGYDVVRRLREAGLRDVADASVYGTLRRLFRAGLLTAYVVPSDEGPHRKYHALNDAGRAQLERSRRTWSEFAATMDHLVANRSGAVEGGRG